MDKHRISHPYRVSHRSLHFWLVFSLLLSACAPGVILAGAKAAAPTNTPIAATQPVTAVVSATAAPAPLPSSTPIPPTAVPILPDRITCGEQTGSLEEGSVGIPLLAKPIRYIVYLPPCYSVELTTRYPVLYLLHGLGSIEDQWVRLGAVSIADQMISSGETRPFIMVFPLDPETKQPREYNFEEVFIHQLLAVIDDNHRTLSTPPNRAIGGISRGGAWALHLGLNHPDLFGAIGGHSTTFFYSDESQLERILLTMPPAQMPRIWLDAGDTDIELELISPFETFLTVNNIPHEWHQFVGAHQDKYWSAHVHDYLEWYTRYWR